MRQLNLNHLVAFLGLVLAVAVFLALRKFNFPDRICMGAAVLSILMVAIFWSAVLVNVGEDDEED